MIHPGSASYPPAMALVAGRWARGVSLYVRGRLPKQRGICVVGSRKASSEALAFAAKVAARLLEEGWSVWSGGAAGIDTSVHFGALDAGGPTVAVLGSGHSRPYPACNGPLFDRIAASGATISLDPDPVKARPYRFLRRNVVLTALTDATVVIQAKRPPSGALHAASAARRLGRPVLCPPDAPWSEHGEGNRILLERGAIPFHDIDELVMRLRAAQSPDPVAEPTARYLRPRADPTVELDDRERALLAHLDDEPTHVDAICAKSGVPYLELSAALVALVLAGQADEPSPGFFRRTSS